MNTSETSRTRTHILDAARGSFMAYGYRRTSMQEIADAAGLSRTAVYLHFRNKEEVFRALVEHLMCGFRQRAEQALDLPDLTDRLSAMLTAKLDTVLDAASSPHGEELLSMHGRMGSDIATQEQARFAGLLRQAIERAGAEEGIDPARIGLDAAAAADLLVAWTHGIGYKATGEAARSRAHDLLRASIAAFVRGLGPVD